MIRKIFSLVGLIILVGCSSAPVQKVEIGAPQFKVLDATPGGREAWHDNPQIYAEFKGWDIKKFYYFSSEAKSANKRLSCEKAHANITDDIAKQISAYVDTAIARATVENMTSESWGTEATSDVSEETERLSSQLAKANLSGVILKKRYWEQRDYSQTGGAKSIYYCWQLAEVSKKEIQKMIRKANTLRVRNNPELKNKVANKLSDLEENYEKWHRTH